MADPTQLTLIKTSVDAWNAWRSANPQLRPNLANADLAQADLSQVNLSGADLGAANLRSASLRESDLRDADMRRANLREADLSGADLSRAKLYRSNLNRTTLSDANLLEADLYRSYLGRANLSRANLRAANIALSVMVDTDLAGADLTGAHVHGISVWDVKGTPAKQADLVITASDEPVVTVDNLKVAQFLYLLLKNEEVRGVIDTITAKVVLILGRFSSERKAVLDALRDKLRQRGLSPVVFDFAVPDDRDVTETVTLLARMARFVIADLTDPRSIPQELQAIAPDVAVPIQPIIDSSQEPWSMFKDLRRKYHWVLDPYRYSSQDALLSALDDVLAPAERKRSELIAP